MPDPLIPEPPILREDNDQTEITEVVRRDRPLIWPESPRPIKQPVKRPLEDWLQEFSERLSREPVAQDRSITRRRRARGLDRILPAPQLARGEEPGRRRGREQRGRRPGVEARPMPEAREGAQAGEGLGGRDRFRSRGRRRRGGRQPLPESTGAQPAAAGSETGALPGQAPPSRQGRNRRGRQRPHRDAMTTGEPGTRQEPAVNGESSDRPFRGRRRGRRRRGGRNQSGGNGAAGPTSGQPAAPE